MLQTFHARVVATRDLTHDVRVITLGLQSPTDMSFEAGQFVSFSVTKPGLPFPLTRPYSIASPPTRTNEIDILLNLVPDGPGSNYLFSLHKDDAVTFKGPAGSFVLRDYPDRGLLFVATGTGIAPFWSMIPARLPSATSVTLLWGLRSERDLYYQDELAALAARHPEFSFETTLSRPSDAWQGAHGHVQQLIERRIAKVDDVAVYICGGSAMTTSVTALIRARGVCPIHKELYYKESADAPAVSDGAPQ